jgi:hypothetical protein
VVHVRRGAEGWPDRQEGGAPGTLEKKWGVRLKLEVKDYDPCLTMYGGGTVDAVCMTNMDALNPALSRASTVIMPTFHVGRRGQGDRHRADKKQAGSNDGCSAPTSRTTSRPSQDLRPVQERVASSSGIAGIEKLGLNPKDFKFENLDPAAAATALQTGRRT